MKVAFYVYNCLPSVICSLFEKDIYGFFCPGVFSERRGWYQVFLYIFSSLYLIVNIFSWFQMRKHSRVRRRWFRRRRWIPTPGPWRKAWKNFPKRKQVRFCWYRGTSFCFFYTYSCPIFWLLFFHSCTVNVNHYIFGGCGGWAVCRDRLSNSFGALSWVCETRGNFYFIFRKQSIHFSRWGHLTF